MLNHSAYQCQRFNTDLAQLEVREVYFCSAGTWEGFEEYVFRSAQRFECRHVSKQGKRNEEHNESSSRWTNTEKEWRDVNWDAHVTAPKKPQGCVGNATMTLATVRNWAGLATALLLGISQNVHPHYELLPSAGQVKHSRSQLLIICVHCYKVRLFCLVSKINK